MTQTRILVVEDEPVVSLDILHRLDKLGYTALPLATTAAEAVELAAKHKPDIILMDIVLGGEADGIDAAAQIRRQDQIPVIYITSHAEGVILHRAKITEPFGYLLKPFEDRELHVCIEMALYKNAMERKLHENERKLATMLSSIGDAVVCTTDQGAIQFFNPTAECLTGWLASDILGKPFSTSIPILDAGTRDPLLDPVEILRSKCIKLPFAGSGILLDRHGAERPVDLTAACIQGQNGEVFGLALVFRDVSERRKTEEALKQSVRNLRKTLEETVKALAMTAEKRDPYTAGHQQRVAKLASAIAEKLGLPADRIDGLRVASLLHDIGKIYIPAEILSKPARLTDMEMGLMKTHSEVGYDILKSVSFPWPVAEMVLQHHERIDGSGYPGGLEAEDILLEARILMVADVVEAMSSHRPYRAALGQEKALDEITKFKGRRYDAAIVEVCLELFSSAGFNFES